MPAPSPAAATSAPLTIMIFAPQAMGMPSQRIRLVEPLSFLARPRRLLAGGAVNKDGIFVVDGPALMQADVVIINRNFPIAHTMPLIRHIAKAGKRIIYETDDGLQLLPDDHPKAFHKLQVPHIEETAALAETVVVSTEPLKACYPDCRQVVVARNMLSPRLWQEEQRPAPRADSGRVRIALVGGNDHVPDFLSIEPALRGIAASHPNVEWAAYGDGAHAALAALGLSVAFSVPRSYEYVTHPARLASMQADIAICPLQDNAFNNCKSDIKAIEFGWLGVPCLVSDLTPYIDSVPAALRCANAPAWQQSLAWLIDDKDARLRVGEAAREYVLRERMLSVENNPWNAILGI